MVDTRITYYRVNDDKTVSPLPEGELPDTQDLERRRVGRTKIGDRVVSTVFLGIDHRFWVDDDGGGMPILFETMIFPEQVYQVRYCTWEEAEEGHKVACRKVENGTYDAALFNGQEPS